MVIALNKGQQEAADLFFKMLLDPDQKEMVITGGAGYGKSFLISWFQEDGMNQYYSLCDVLGVYPFYCKEDFCLTATTNKAAEVLTNAIGDQVETIHSFLGLKVMNNFETGTTSLERNQKWHINHNKIIVIDECSMIDQELYEYIKQACDNTCKIIYVGDKNQLVPVKSGLSPVFKNNIPIVELTEVVRFANTQPLVDLANQLKETVETGIFKPIQLVPGVIDLYDNTTMQNSISSTFANPDNESRIVTYTNNRSILYNSFIRNDVRHYKNLYEPGEHFISTTNCHITSKKMLHVEDEIIIKNIDYTPKTVNVTAAASYEAYEAFCTNYSGESFKLNLPVNILQVRNDIKFFGKAKNWTSYFYLKDWVPDLRPRDSCTIHKVQGTTLDSVYIDLSDLSSCRNPDTAARLLYVACTRARRHIIFYGSLAKKYGGLIK